MEKKYKNAEHLKERQVQKVKDLNEQIATVNEVMDDMTNELEMFRKRYMGDQMLVNGVKKECDGLKEKLTKADGKSKEQQEINNENKKKLDELKKENDKWKVMNQHFVQLNCDLEKERDSLNEKYQVECNEHKKTENKLKNELNQNKDLKKKIKELDTKLNQQKALYETIRQDRNQYSKKLVES
jgi:chromosome segregation ATPase